MNMLGVYIGPEIISISESNGKRLINTVRILQKAVSAGEFEEKVPEEIKMVALFKDEIRKNNITAKEVNLALSGKDLIIRTFEMPPMPAEDLSYAVTFEAKKHMPFKLEELILDFQVYFDRAIRRNIVLVVGIKKEVLDKYLSIFQQLGLKIISLEYAAFSVFRLLKLAGFHERGVAGIVEADFLESDEASFTALENGFPLFSRDITLASSQMPPAAQVIEPQAVLDKLKVEARVSLDYYHRKFPAKNVNKVYFVSNMDYKSELEAMAKEIGLSQSYFIDVEKHIGRPIGFSLSFLKSYSVSIAKVIKAPTGIDLIAAKKRQAQKALVAARKADVGGFLTQGLRVEPAVVVLSISICIASFLFGIYQRFPIQKEISAIKAARPQVALLNADQMDNPDLEALDMEYRNTLFKFDALVKRQLYLTSPFSVIPRVIPDGIWLTGFSLTGATEDNKPQATLRGTAYVRDGDQEIRLINEFVSKLKADPEFFGYFSQVRLSSIEEGQFEKVRVTNFIIECNR